MQWLTVLAAVVTAVRTFIEWLAETKRIDAAVAQAVLQGVRESDEAIKRAQDARASVRGDLGRDPGGLRDDDGFKREGD